MLNEPVFHTETDLDKINNIITGGEEPNLPLGKPNLIKIGAQVFDYSTFYKKYTKGIKNDTDGGMSLLDSVKRIITKLGGPPVIFRWGKLSHYNFVNEDNTIDCDALTHWSGSTGLLECCQFNAPMPNGFGLEAYPEKQLVQNKRICLEKGLGPDKYSDLSATASQKGGIKKKKKCSKKRNSKNKCSKKRSSKNKDSKKKYSKKKDSKKKDSKRINKKR